MRLAHHVLIDHIAWGNGKIGCMPLTSYPTFCTPWQAGAGTSVHNGPSCVMAYLSCPADTSGQCLLSEQGQL